MSRLNRVIEHAAGDLTVTVEAGVRLDDLQTLLAGSGQFLAIDPPFGGTIGGLIAVADSGPKRLRYGGVRDLILGVTFVRSDGVIAKGGGKVVKNVAGYDMPKLLTGSLGTLGVVVEATFRLHPIPLASATVITPCHSVLDITKAAPYALRGTLVPTQFDYFSGSGDEQAVLAVRFESSPRSVRAQAEMLARQLGAASSVLSEQAEAQLWQRFGSVSDTFGSDVLARLISTPSDLPSLILQAQRDAEQHGIGLAARAHAGHGHALLKWQSPDTASALLLLKNLRERAAALSASVVVWKASSEVRLSVDVWGDVGEGISLMRRVKAQFDPNNILNPGRFVGGI